MEEAYVCLFLWGHWFPLPFWRIVILRFAVGGPTHRLSSVVALAFRALCSFASLCSTFVSSLLFSKHGREGPAGRGKSGSEHQRLCIIPRRRPGEWGVEGIEHAAAQLEEACVLEMEGTEPWCGALHHVQVLCLYALVKPCRAV